jgi:hypothetical protein
MIHPFSFNQEVQKINRNLGKAEALPQGANNFFPGWGRISKAEKHGTKFLALLEQILQLIKFLAESLIVSFSLANLQKGPGVFSGDC